MKEKLKNIKGITLIALVITIIVMIILVAVSVTVALNGGLFQTAKTATGKTELERDKEILMAAAVGALGEDGKVVYENIQTPTGFTKVSNGIYTKGDNTFRVDEYGGIIVGEFEDEDLALLKEYFLGEDKSIATKINAPSPGNMWFEIPNSDENIEVIDFDMYNGIMTTLYNKKIFILNLDFSTETVDCTGVQLVNKTKGREGKKVLYSYDGSNANLKEWTIIHDNGDNVEILSPDVFGRLTLGIADTSIDTNDEEIVAEADIDGTEGISGVEATIYSYNHAIETIDNYCKGFITNENKLSVRSVGSDPTNPLNESNDFFESEELSGSYLNGVVKQEDRHYVSDLYQMICLNITGEVNDEYYLASRCILNNNSEFYIVRGERAPESVKVLIWFSDGLLWLNNRKTYYIS